MTVTTSATSELHPLAEQLTLRRYLAEIWRRRDFLLVVPRQDARARHMDNVLGQLWYVLNPALSILIYYLIFGKLLSGGRGVPHYVSYLTVGVMLFQVNQRTVIEGSMLIDRYRSLIRSIQFPRALLPLSTIIEQFTSFLPTVPLLYLVVVLDGAPIRWEMMLFPLTLVPLASVTAGMMLITARIGSVLPDLRSVLPHLFRLLMYVSGIIFSIDALVSDETLRIVMKANPIYGTLALSRWAIIQSPVDAWTLGTLAFWSTILPVVGFAYFRQGENGYGG